VKITLAKTAYKKRIRNGEGGGRKMAGGRWGEMWQLASISAEGMCS
jgi:hypothetical protein